MQVSVACAIMAVEMSLICKSQTGVNCTAAAAETFTLNISASATDSQVRPALQLSWAFCMSQARRKQPQALTGDPLASCF